MGSKLDVLEAFRLDYCRKLQVSGVPPNFRNEYVHLIVVLYTFSQQFLLWRRKW
jgi:hypothetical protein